MVLIDDQTPQGLHAQLAGLVAKLSQFLPEHVRPVETSVLDKKLDELTRLTRASIQKSTVGLKGVEQIINNSAAVVHERLEHDRAERRQIDSIRDAQLQSLKGAIEKLAKFVSTSAETAGEALASSPGVQTIEERLATAVRAAIDSSANPDRLLRIDQVLELFDIFAGYRDFWEKGLHLTPEEKNSEVEVVSVLRDIAARIDHWADVQRLEPFPAADAGQIEFDEIWHRRVSVELTSDPALGDRIARVERVGYKWKGDRLRKADVVVYKYSPVLDPVAVRSGAG
jgi:hypothetical protein